MTTAQKGPSSPSNRNRAAAVELFAAGRFAEREPAGEGFQGEVGRFRRQVGAYQPEIVFVVAVLPAVVLEIVVPDAFDERELPCVQIEPGELDRRLPLRAAGLGRVVRPADFGDVERLVRAAVVAADQRAELLHPREPRFGRAVARVVVVGVEADRVAEIEHAELQQLFEKGLPGADGTGDEGRFGRDLLQLRIDLSEHFHISGRFAAPEAERAHSAAAVPLIPELEEPHPAARKADNLPAVALISLDRLWCDRIVPLVIEAVAVIQDHQRPDTAPCRLFEIVRKEAGHFQFSLLPLRHRP